MSYMHIGSGTIGNSNNWFNVWYLFVAFLSKYIGFLLSLVVLIMHLEVLHGQGGGEGFQGSNPKFGKELLNASPSGG